MARTKTTKAKPNKANLVVVAPASAEAPRDNRYLRASRIIIERPDITSEELARAANMSVSTAGHCREAFKGVTAALREARLLPVKELAPEAEAVTPVVVEEEPKAEVEAVAA